MKNTQRIADYGYFDTKDGCFVLTKTPPRKWNNVHFNEPREHEIYAEVSNIGDGPITVRDNAGCSCQVVGYDSKYVYIRDEESKAVFNPGGAPVPTAVTNYSTRYYAAKTVSTATCKGLKVTQRTFCPRQEIFEAHTITVQNKTNRPRTVSVFAYCMFQLTGNGPKGQGVWKDNATEILPELGSVFCRNRERSVPNGRFNGYIATLNQAEYVAATGYRDFFTNQSFSLAAPRILDGSDLDNQPFRGPDSAGALQVRLVIPAKGTVRADFIIGQAADVAELQGVLARTTPASLDAACEEQHQIERTREKAFTVDTGNPDRDALYNLFSKKAMVSYLINKSGFRDNLQNDLGVSLFDYPMARANLLRAISSQYLSGSVPHGFRPYNLHQYSDKPAWMLHCVPWVLKESGDLAFLDEKVGYYDAPEQKETIWEHMQRAMRFLAKDVGANGLCDQHFADWNDGLEPSEKTGARESVMVTQQLCLGLVEMRDLAKRRGDAAVEKEASDLHAHFTQLLNTVAWDGDWYVRTICSGGYIMGSDANAEGKIFVNTQSWAVMSQTAPRERALAAMAAVDRMIETEFGYSICAPAFEKFDERIGKYSASRPYYAENGGCYNHAAGFKAVADCMLGRAEEAWRTVLKVMPDAPANPIGNSQIEPFSFTNCFSRTQEWPGIGMYPWRTGTTAWFTQVMVEWILGARRHYDGLLIDPCLSKEIPHAKLTRTFRGATFVIEIDNTAGRCRGVTKLTVNGVETNDRILRARPGKKYKVQVVL